MAETATVSIVIKAVTTGFEDAMNRGGKAVSAFNRAAGDSARVFSSLNTAIGGMIGAFAGFAGMRTAIGIMQEASAAGYNMEASLAAANREFGNIGGVDQWNEAIGRLSGELAIYSDTALKGAVSRTVDMTKRLGLSAEQMETVISLTGDLSAGKTDLEGGIERVTAALRGEAEASEYLGLTLNENYVKSWYEASGAMQGAWKDLTDLEKAQVRYNVFLEQAQPMQGRAAASVTTLGGAMQLVRKEIENAVVNNQGAIDAAKNLSAVIRENAGSIGQLVSWLITATAHVAQFVAANHQAIAVVGAVAGAVVVLVKVFQTVSTAVGIVKGLNAAILELTGANITGWAKKAVADLGAVNLASLTLQGTLKAMGGIAAAAFVGWEFGKWLNQFDFVQKAALGVIHTLDKLRLTAQKMWAVLTGGDVAAIDRQMEIAKQAYADGIAEIENKGKEKPQTQAEPAKRAESSLSPMEQQWQDYLKSEEAKNAEEKEKPAASDTESGQKDGEDAGKKEDWQEWLDQRYAGIDQKKAAEQPVKVYDESGKWQYHYGSKDGLEERDGKLYSKEPQKPASDTRTIIDQGNGWSRIEEGGKLLKAVATNALNATPKLVQYANGWSRIEKDPIQQEKARQSGAKVVELKFKGGSLSGGEADVEALLRQLEEAGLKA